jgi:hypothetical protein
MDHQQPSVLELDGPDLDGDPVPVVTEEQDRVSEAFEALMRKAAVLDDVRGALVADPVLVR